MNRKRVSKAIVHQPAAQFYDRFVEAIKKRIRTAQIKAALAANAQLVLHYWEIGRDILASQKREGWGAKVIDRLANDLQQEFRSSLVIPLATSNTCALSPRRGQTVKLCNNLLHKFHGAKIASCSIV